MSTAMLPKLNPDKNVQQWVGSKWSRIGSLKEIADAIDSIDANSHENRFSIPDTYEKAIRFTSIIRNQGVENDKELPYEVIQWRSLLTILALQGIKEYPVSFKKVGCEEYRNDFIRALRLEPEGRLVKGAGLAWSWLPFYVMQYGNAEIAIFSPATLLYPVVELESGLRDCGEISWFDEKTCVFQEPQFYLSEEEKIITFAWLSKLTEFLENIRSQSLESRGRISVDMELLGALMSNVRNYQDTLLSRGRTEARRKASELRNSWKWITERDNCFDTYNYGLNVASVLNVTIAPETKIENKAIELGGIFSEKLIYFVGQNPFSRCRGADCCRLRDYSAWNNVEKNVGQAEAFALLPFSESFMNIIASSSQETAKTLCQAIEIVCRSEFTSTGRRDYVLVEVELERLNPENFRISKKFYVDSDASESQVICGNNDSYAFMLHMWPDMKLKGWKAYFTYFMHETIGEVEASYELIFPNGSIQQRGKHSIRTEEYPAAYGFTRNGKFVGMVIPAVPEETDIELASRAVVSVDFGTTGTKMFAQVNEREEEIYLEDENIATVINYTQNQTTREASLRDQFVPDRRSGNLQKLFSVYHYFYKKNMLEILLDGNISLPENISEWLNKEGDTKSGRIQLSNVATNLKWKKEATQKYLSVFLLQICMQTTVFLLKRYNISTIEWRYSVPSSMSDEQIQSIRNTWNGVCDSLKAFTGISHSLFAENINLYEGYMASFYFDIIKKGNYAQGFLAIDIGGGTTDLALWKMKDKTISACMQSSVRMAGRRMLTAAIWDYVEDFQRLVRGNALLESYFQAIAERKAGVKRLPRDDENTVIDQIIATHGETLKRLIRLNADGVGWIRKFQARLSMNMAMLFYCLGRMMAEAIFTKKYDISTDNEASFWICVGGNGSCILDWISVSDWKDLNGILKAPYINMFRIARAYELDRLRVEEEKKKDIIAARESDWKRIEWKWGLDKIDIQIYKSEQPKEEVARGLLEVSTGFVQGLRNEKTKKADDIDRDVLMQYTKEFLDLYKEEFDSTQYFEELVDESGHGESGKINYQDNHSLKMRIDDLFRYDNNDENDAASSYDIYQCLLDYVLADFLIEDVRPGR